MKLKDLIFGSKSQANISQHPTLTPEQQEALKALLAALGEPDATEQLGSGLEFASLEALSDLSRQLTTGQGVGATLQAANTALQRALDPRGEDFEQFFQDAVFRPMMQQFQEDILPTLSNRFAASGFHSSDRLRQEERATEDLLEALTGKRAELAFTARENALTRALQAAQLAPGVAGAPVEIQDLLNRAGARRRQERLNALLQAIGVQGVENIATVTPGMPGAFQAILGGVGEGLGKAAAGKFIL